MTPENLDQIFGPFGIENGNFNLMILGASGSGKTFATKLGIHRGAGAGIVSHVVDFQGEYLNLAQHWAGQTLSPGEALAEKEAPITVMDLHQVDCKDHPKAVLKHLQQVWERASRDPKVPRAIVIDEVLPLFQDHEAASLINSLAIEGRKHLLGVVTTTQDTAWVMESGQRVMQNAWHKLLFQQRAEEMPKLAEALQLEQDQQGWLTSCPRGQGLRQDFSETVPIRVSATTEEEELIR